jgi:multiple sugar transport system permease protein
VRLPRIFSNLIAYSLLTLGALTMMAPLWWMISTSLKDISEVFVFPPDWFPWPPRWSNYGDAWLAVPFGRFYINSLVVSFSVTAGQVITSAMAAYAFARLAFPGREKLFFIYLATLIIPGVVTMIPVFCILKFLGEVINVDLQFGSLYLGKLMGLDSYFALIVPGLFSAYGTFLCRQYFLSIPVELEEAARIDGLSVYGIFIRIIMPLSRPALATLVIFTFIGSWRDFIWPLIVCSSIEMKTLPVGLNAFQGLYRTDWPLLMAASVMVMAPMIIIFLLNQRFFVEGIKLSGIKG